MDSRNDTNAGDDVENTTAEKQPFRPTPAEMVMESIKSLNMSNGVPLLAIKAFIGEYYGANLNLITEHIMRSLENAVKTGILEQIAGEGDNARFKLKETGGLASQTKRKIKEQAAGDGEDERFKQMETRGPSATPRKRKIKELAAGDGDDALFKKKKIGGPTTQRKLGVKDIPEKSVKKSRGNLDHNAKSSSEENSLSLPQMVVESIKSLKKRKGASFEAIREYMADHFRVDEKAVTPKLKAFLKAGVQRGVLENTSDVGAEGRFKVKTTEGIRGYTVKKG